MAASRARSPFNAFLKVGFFHNDYIDTLLFLEEIQLKDKEEKTQFLEKLGERAVGMFPDDICRYKVCEGKCQLRGMILAPTLSSGTGMMVGVG